MPTHKFATKEAALDHLTKDKKPTCVAALTDLFTIGLTKGYDFRTAYHFSYVTHALADHDAANRGPTLNFEPTDQNARAILVDEIMQKNDDNQAEDRVDLVMKWYDLFREWGGTTAMAFVGSINAAQEEWDFAHSLSQKEAIEKVNALGLDPDTKTIVINHFYEALANGESVNEALTIAKDEAQEYLEKQVFMLALQEMLSGKGGPDLPRIN